MTDDVFAQLTEGQRVCLRMIFEGWSIKQIAAKLDIGVSTVNQRLERARRTLGASSSKDAARLLAVHERPPGTWTFPTRSKNPLRPEPHIGSDEALKEPGGEPGNAGDSQDGVAPPLPVRPPAFPWPFPTRGRPINDLSFAKRSMLVLGIAGAAMLALLLLTLLTIGFQDITGPRFRHEPDKAARLFRAAKTHHD